MGNDTTRLTCATNNCGTFVMDTALVNKLKETGDDFHCPSGHPQHFTGEDTHATLKKRITELENKLERQRKRADDLRETCREYWDETRELRETIKTYRDAILEQSDGAVELPDGEYSWACGCGSHSRTSFESEREAWSNYDKHRDRGACEDSSESVTA